MKDRKYERQKLTRMMKMFLCLLCLGWDAGWVVGLAGCSGVGGGGGYLQISGNISPNANPGYGFQVHLRPMMSFFLFFFLSTTAGGLRFFFSIFLFSCFLSLQSILCFFHECLSWCEVSLFRSSCSLFILFALEQDELSQNGTLPKDEAETIRQRHLSRLQQLAKKFEDRRRLQVALLRKKMAGRCRRQLENLDERHKIERKEVSFPLKVSFLSFARQKALWVSRREAIIIVVSDLTEMLSLVTFVQARRFCRRCKSGCAALKDPPPLEAVLVIFGRRALLFFLFV